MKSLILILSLVLANSAMAKMKAAMSAPVVVPVAGVYAPEAGFDDNDTIQIVVDGVLPNACWVMDRTEAKLIGVHNDIVVQQYARKYETEICKDESKLPSELQVPVTFMGEVTMGPLPQGEYTMVYSSIYEGKMELKKFNVSAAPTNEVDSLYYAITTELAMPKIVSASAPTFDVKFSGYLSSPCSDIEPEALVSVQTDVIVLMPQVHRTPGTCLPVAKEFTRYVRLKTPASGRYLLQIRSANGEAVNRLFTVK